MNLYIEIKDRLPYALTPSSVDDGDDAYDLLCFFNDYQYNQDESAGAKTFSVWPDQDEFQEWMRRENIAFAAYGPRKIRIDEISSILATA